MSDSPLDILRNRQAVEREVADKNAELRQIVAIDQFFEFYQHVPAHIEAREYRDCVLGEWNGAGCAMLPFQFIDIDAGVRGIPLLLIYNDKAEILPIFNASGGRENKYQEGKVFTREILEEFIQEDSSEINHLTESTTYMKMLEQSVGHSALYNQNMNLRNMYGDPNSNRLSLELGRDRRNRVANAAPDDSA